MKHIQGTSIIKYKIIKLLLGFILSLFLVSCGNNNNLEEENKNLVEELANSKNDLKKLESELTKVNEEFNKNREELKKYKEKMEPFEKLSDAELKAKMAEAELSKKKAEEELEKKKVEEEKKKAEEEKKKAEEEEKKAQEAAKKADEEKKAQEAKEKQGYETGITFEQLARTPDKYTLEKVKFTGKIIQVMEGKDYTQYRFLVDDDYDKVILIEISKEVLDNTRILEKDNVTIYGSSMGLITYDSTLGGKITVPAIVVEKFTIN